MAEKDGEIIVSVPDLITMVEEDTGEPITTEQLRYGFRVIVLGMPSHRHWRSAKALEVVGPRYFGYDIDYVPIDIDALYRWEKSCEHRTNAWCPLNWRTNRAFKLDIFVEWRSTDVPCSKSL